jgi:hypothetical protein
MSTKDYKAREIIINIAGGGDAGPRKKKKKRKAPARASKRSEAPGRRRISAADLNFFDLGRTAAGVDRTFAVTPNETVPGNFPIILEDFAATVWQPVVRDAVLAITPRKENSHRIGFNEIDRYGMQISVNNIDVIAVNTSNPNWTPKGYKLDAAPAMLTAFDFAPIGFPFATNNVTTFKMTSAPSYAAADVVPSLAKKIDVFLCPHIAMHNIYSSASGDVSTNNDAVAGGGYFDLIPRDVFRDFSENGFLNFEAWRTYIAGRPTNRTWTQTGTGTSTPGGTVSAAPPAAFGRVTFFTGAFSIPATGYIITDASPPEGMLIAIIETGGNTYYIWLRSSIPGSVPGSYSGNAP